MPKIVEKHQTKQVLGVTEQKLSDVKEWIYLEIEDALAFRRRLEQTWRTALKMYEGVPKLETRDIPIEGAPNIEVTIGAIAADTIYAQAIDLIFNTSPFATVRTKPNKRNDLKLTAAAKALQRFVNHLGSTPEYGLRTAVETSVLDDIQLGTGLMYIPWVERIKKTKSAKVLSSGPRFFAHPLEDCIVPAGSYDSSEDLPIFSLRFYRTLADMQMLAKRNNWDLDGIQPISMKENVRTTREQLGKNSEPTNRNNALYDLHRVYCFYDIDDDGFDEDLEIMYNHSGRKILSISYNPMDRRPLERMLFQRRAHLWYGLGVLQMMMPYEEKITDLNNYATLNALLANSRMWIGSEGLPETMKVWPGKYIQTPNPREDLQALQMADVYNSIWQDQMITMQLANQRVGINDVSRPNSIPSRTPGITAMSFLQQVNKRFVPAFDSISGCITASIRQALYRYQERLLAGDLKAEASILAVLGPEDGFAVIDLLKKESFDEHVDVELTATSASVNREADRQSSIMLTNILGQYYQRTIELINIAANPATPPEVREVAGKIINSANEVIDRTIRTFDQVRDPAQFVIEVEEELNSIEQTAGTAQAVSQLIGMIGAGAGAEFTGAAERPLELPGGGA